MPIGLSIANSTEAKKMIEWVHGLRCHAAKSVCRRFTLHSHAYGLYSLYDYEGENWADRATLPDGRMAPSVSTFRSMKAAKHEAARRMNE